MAATRKGRDIPVSEDGHLDVVVTHLEMLRPEGLIGSSQRPPAPQGRKLALLRAERPSVAFYRFLYNTVGAPWLWWERREMDDATLAAIIGDDRVEIYVLYAEGVPAGYAEIERRGTSTVHLAYFGLMPEFIGQRLGPFLLGAALEIAWGTPGEASVERLTLNTCSLDHPKALSLYQRFGFKPVRQERRRVKDPRVTGLI